jgi:hypothetical protein
VKLGVDYRSRTFHGGVRNMGIWVYQETTCRLCRAVGSLAFEHKNGSPSQGSPLCTQKLLFTISFVRMDYIMLLTVTFCHIRYLFPSLASGCNIFPAITKKGSSSPAFLGAGKANCISRSRHCSASSCTPQPQAICTSQQQFLYGNVGQPCSLLSLAVMAATL